MKKIIYLFAVLIAFVSCNKDTDFVSFSGKITNNTIDSLTIFHPKLNFRKRVKINEDGTFKDTLKVKNGLFSFTNNKDFALLYLINGDNITMTFDEGSFDKTINFTGDHEAENNFLATSIAKENEFFSDTELMRLSKKDFDNKVTAYISDYNERLETATLDADFKNHEKEEIVDFKVYIEKQYLDKNYGTLMLGKGKTSPKFLNYENNKGGNISLDDLKGKYVYIDVWATWCVPCIKEMPSLDKIEKQYHGKNIEFVSISIDAEKDYKAWKKMIVDKKLDGTQLYAKGDQKFMSAYKITSIPRFILIDPKGNIVNANAPRPSDPKLGALLNSLKI